MKRFFLFIGILMLVPAASAIDSAYTTSPPTIDGTLSQGEWSNGMDITLNGYYHTENTMSGRLYVLNCNSDLYIAIVIEDSTDTLSDWAMVDFDQGNDHVATDGGEDAMDYYYGIYADYYWDEVWWAADIGAGGTSHGSGARSYSNGEYTYEFSKPLDSGEGKDMSLSLGDVVGFRIEIWDDAVEDNYRYPQDTVDSDTARWDEWTDLYIATATTTSTTSTLTTTLTTGATCSSCEDCSSKLDGSYETVYLTTDLLDQTETCIQVSSGYVEFDCQGHTISGDEYAGAGVNIADSFSIWSVTVRNCVVEDFWYGIRLLNAFSCDIIGNTVTSNNNSGIRTENSFYNSIENNTITGNQFGLQVTGANHPNYIRNNIVSSNSWIGIYLYNADYTRVNENEACYNAESDFWTKNSDEMTGTNNTCDVSGGWNDTNITGCTFSCAATTTTITGCSMTGDSPPCDEITLSEVIDLINLWAADGATLSQVIDLINAWASG